MRKKVGLFIAIIIILIAMYYIRSESMKINLVEEIELDLNSVDLIRHTYFPRKDGQPEPIQSVGLDEHDEIIRMMRATEGKITKDVVYLNLWDDYSFKEHEFIIVYIGNLRKKYVINIIDLIDENGKLLMYYYGTKTLFWVDKDDEFCNYFIDKVIRMNKE